MTSSVTVSAVVVTWNSAERLPGLLESLAAQAVDLELVQVDNASTDASLEQGRRWTGPLRQIRNDDNLGFAAGLALGVDEASGEFILVVNADVRWEADALATLLKCLQADAGLGAAGPKLLGTDGRVQPTCARQLPGLRSSILHGLGLRRVVEGTALDPYTYRPKEYEIERDVPALSGAAMLIRREALERAGGVDTRWFMYLEDIDICARLARAGYRLRFCPAAVARHEGAASSPRSPELEAWLAVHLQAAIGAFLRLHRGRTVAGVHRAAVALNGLARMASAAVRRDGDSTTPRRAAFARGAGLVGWALTGTMPRRGAPARRGSTRR